MPLARNDTRTADGEAFADVISGALPSDAEVKDAAGWTSVDFMTSRPRPRQGWKLHVSAYPANAAEVLQRVAQVLIAERTPFKFSRSQAQLALLNAGLAGASQVGKFLTAYPDHDESAVHLAQ